MVRFTVLSLFLFSFFISSSFLLSAHASTSVDVSVSVSGLDQHLNSHALQPASDQEMDYDAPDEAAVSSASSSPGTGTGRPSKLRSMVNRGKQSVRNANKKIKDKLGFEEKRNQRAPGTAEPAVEALRQLFASRAWGNANRVSLHLCGRYVCKAINDAFNELGSSRRLACQNAYLLGPNLESVGFKRVSIDHSAAQVGDVIVIDRFSTHIYGHVAIMTSNGWASDYRQPDWNPYRRTPPRYVIYRYDP